LKEQNNETGTDRFLQHVEQRTRVACSTFSNVQGLHVATFSAAHVLLYHAKQYMQSIQQMIRGIVIILL